MDHPTRGEKRDRKRKKNRKMRVDGRSVLTLDEIIRRKAKKAKERRREWGDDTTGSDSSE